MHQQSPSTTTLSKPKQKTVNDKTEMVALNMMILEPKAAYGYLLAGQLYEKQHRYGDAQDIYAKALMHIPPTQEEYYELQHSLKKLNIQQGSFIHRLPYHVSCSIFSYLTPDALVECIDVSRSWNLFILQDPKFWDQLSDIIDSGISDPKEENACLYIQPRCTTFHMAESRSMFVLITSLLKFVAIPGASNIREIHFEAMTLVFEYMDLIVRVVQSPNSILKRLSFNFVEVGHEEHVLGSLLGRCPQLRHFSFKNNIIGDRRYSVKEPFMVPNVGYRTVFDDFSYDTYMLTTFEFSMNVVVDDVILDLVPKFIKRCPYLEIMRIDSSATIAHNEILIAALGHCHHLKDIVVSNQCRIPDSVTNSLDESKTNGLQRFVLSSTYDKVKHTAITDMVKKHHNTLSVLYLGLDDKVVNENLLGWCVFSYRFPQLQELHLKNDFKKRNFKRNRIDAYIRFPHFSKIMIAIARCCPNLRILHVIEDPPLGGVECNSPITDDAILFLFKHCPYLEQLKIDTMYRNINECNLTLTTLELFKDILARSSKR
ncbi:hypothetical protein K492DRAFT_194484 [Lichtheimia hyalospora FSU 10163]|nr:hypothetical protein K492DRAFT_194484 [Lichtheimia hyalospora FSU 10163]